jgi:hypothetical protein
MPNVGQGGNEDPSKMNNSALAVSVAAFHRLGLVKLHLCRTIHSGDGNPRISDQKLVTPAVRLAVSCKQ